MWGSELRIEASGFRTHLGLGLESLGLEGLEFRVYGFRV